MVKNSNNTGMMLIADSGSTKADWVLIKEGNNIVTTFSTKGLNPNILSDEQIVFELNKEIQLKELHEADINLFFYGAGCSGVNNLKRMQNVLGSFFKFGLIEVRSDMEAAVYATCNDQPAIVAILGTGSNSCLFSEGVIKATEFSLGYILGDEGSGNYFGKILLRDYFYNNLPKDLTLKFIEKFNVTREDVLKRVYKEPFPNEYIASFLPFYAENIEHEYCKNIISNGLTLFLKIYIRRFEEHTNLPVHFVGSVGYYFDSHLKEACSKLNIEVKKVIKKPITQLAQYHIIKNSNSELL